MARSFSPAWLERHRVDVGSLARSDVVGIGHVLAEVDALVARLRDPERAAAMGLEPPRGILFWGEPGLGKTLVARHLAASLGAGVPFYEVSADELTPERIRGSLRHLAAAHPRSIVYMDEIDVFAMNRDFEGHDPETRMRLSAMLAGLDGLVATAGPVVIASSNRPAHQLDAALTRSGRLGDKVHFNAPDEAEREALLRLFTRDIPTERDIDWRSAARLTRAKSPADLRQIVEDAAGLALAADRDILDGADLLAEPAAARRRIAIHESGHVAACVALRGPDWVYAVRLATIEGVTSYGDERIPVHLRPDGEHRDALVVALAGGAAEEALLGEAPLGGREDVKAATDVALERAGVGLAGRAIPLALERLEPNVAEMLKGDLADALLGQMEIARQRARAIVAANVEAIARFAALLEAAGELTGEPLADAITEAGFVAAEAMS